jgi:hypothetical protein
MRDSITAAKRAALCNPRRPHQSCNPHQLRIPHQSRIPHQLHNPRQSRNPHRLRNPHRHRAATGKQLGPSRANAMKRRKQARPQRVRTAARIPWGARGQAANTKEFHGSDPWTGRHAARLPPSHCDRAR